MGGHRGLFVGSVAIVALVVGLASGCTGAQGASGPDASPSPPGPTSTNPTASSTPSATLDDEARARIPQAARAHTAKGAEAFARFYLQQVNEAWMAPDPELIRPYALESCKTCANLVSSAEWLVRHGSKYDSRPTTVGPSVVLPESTDVRVLVRVVQSQEASRIINAAGDVQKAFSRVSGESEVEVRWRDSGWSVGYIKDVHA